MLDHQIIRIDSARFGCLAPPLWLKLGRSWRLGLLLCLLHAAVTAGFVFARPDLLGLSVALGGLCSLLLALREHAFRLGPAAIVGLAVEPGGKVTAHRRDGRSSDVRILGSTFMHPSLCVINLRSIPAADGKPVSSHVILMADAVERQAYRRLRVWLTWGWRHEESGQTLHAR